jgi:hypothetical protein
MPVTTLEKPKGVAEETPGKAPGEAPEEGSEDKSEENRGTTEAFLSKGMEAFLSPEAFIMLPWAILLDAIGIILFCFALDDFFLLDIIGIPSIGLWSYFHSQMRGKAPTEAPSVGQRTKPRKIVKGKGLTGTTKWAGRLKWLRPLCITGELFPYVGDVFPGFTLWVISELLSD